MPQPRLNPRYTFERFVVGPENRLAHAASQAVADKPGAVYNPLFIYGATGLGKTHLLHGIGHRVWTSHHRVLYATSEQFTNDFIEAIRRGSTEELRAKYRHLDVLLIDDIQFLAGKEGTQEEFFNTFNDLHCAGSQIVISSDRSPRLISLLEDRLRSRFAGGLIVDIQPPVLETRLAILRAKSLEQSVHLPSEVLHFLAERSRQNIRELEGSFNRIVAHARLLRAEITLDIAVDALSPTSPRERTYPSPDTVIKAVGEYFTLTPNDLCGKSRAREIADARHIAMYLLARGQPPAHDRYRPHPRRPRSLHRHPRPAQSRVSPGDGHPFAPPDSGDPSPLIVVGLLVVFHPLRGYPTIFVENNRACPALHNPQSSARALPTTSAGSTTSYPPYSTLPLIPIHQPTPLL